MWTNRSQSCYNMLAIVGGLVCRWGPGVGRTLPVPGIEDEITDYACNGNFNNLTTLFFYCTMPVQPQAQASLMGLYLYGMRTGTRYHPKQAVLILVETTVLRGSTPASWTENFIPNSSAISGAVVCFSIYQYVPREGLPQGIWCRCTVVFVSSVVQVRLQRLVADVPSQCFLVWTTRICSCCYLEFGPTLPSPFLNPT
jgi:hypothetical protein